MATGCQQQSSLYFGTVKPRHGPQEIWINNSSEPEWLDPGRCSDSTGGEIIWNTFEGLVQAHPATLKPLPAIATHWDISDDGRVYRFYLRPSFWSDGHPLTADDFVFALRRLVDPQTGSKYASNGFIFEKGLAISRGEAAVNSLGVRALDSHTLEIELVDPLAIFSQLPEFLLVHAYSTAPFPKSSGTWH